MKKNNNNIDIAQLFNNVRDQIALETSVDNDVYTPNILEFVYSKKYLNLQQKLFPFQEIILKTFYRKSKGNENIELTEEEIKLLTDNGLDKPGSVLEKYNTDYIFRSLVLVLGRRSGKNFITSIFAVYEAMKLLEIPGGNPFNYYGLAPGNPIFILTVATSAEQANLLFGEIKNRMQNSEYFKNKIGKVESDRIYLLTPDDKKNNTECAPELRTPGSIVIMSGHSNSEGLRGKRIFALLLDEVASFKTTGGSSSGNQIYTALTPGTTDFKSPNSYYIDKKGNKRRYYDSKIISISSPKGEQGILYKLYKESPINNTTLAFRLPTWKVNLQFDEDSLREESGSMTPVEFGMEFGAEFAGKGGDKFILDKYVDEALMLGDQLNLDQRMAGKQGIIYYAHLDPACNSHNYALVILHIEERIRIRVADTGKETKEKIKLFVVDHVKIWQPTIGKEISVKDVDDYIIALSTRFRFAMVSYDDWQSVSSVQKLRSKGIPSKRTPFRKNYKTLIYNHVESLLINNELALPRKGPHARDLELELKSLKKIFTYSGYKIERDKEGERTTDDLADALAGAIGSSLNSVYNGYPKAGSVSLSQHSAYQQMWNIGRGTYNQGQWKMLSDKIQG